MLIDGAIAADPPAPPVYPDLAAVLDGPDPTPTAPLVADPRAHVLAVASGYAYADDARTVATVLARLGMVGCRCVRVSEEVDALLITSTAYLVQSADGATVVVAYRGTRPTGFVDVLGDIDTAPTPVHGAGPLAGTEVHSGFHRNARATRAEVLARLEAALAGHPIVADPERDGDGVPRRRGPLEPMRSLHVTGHSLGGAMAALSTALLCGEAPGDPRRRAVAETLRTVATFGQPMVGSPAFARAAGALPWPAAPGERLDDHLLRWVYRDDVVPRTPIRSSGPYAHFGRERRGRRGAGWQPEGPRSDQLDGVTALVLSPASFLAQTFALTRDRWWGPSIEDHLPERYIEALRPAGTASEYGD